MDPDISNWMSTLPSCLLDKSLNELAIPGTHDSFSYDLDPTSEMGPDVPHAVKAFGTIGKGIVYKWSVTQSQTFLEQLESGIRYFDLRVASRAGSQDIFFLHGLYGHSVDNYLLEMNSFLDSHNKEVIFLDFNHFYNMTPGHHKKLIERVCEVFGSKVCMFVGVDNVSLNMMWENGLQVILLYHDRIADEDPMLWPGVTCIRAPWANTPSVPKLIQYLDTTYQQHREGIFHVAQGILSPDTAYILSHLSGSIKNDLAKKAMPPFLSWLDNKHPGPTGVNICIADFTDLADYDFVKRVVKLNHSPR